MSQTHQADTKTTECYAPSWSTHTMAAWQNQNFLPAQLLMSLIKVKFRLVIFMDLRWGIRGGLIALKQRGRGGLSCVSAVCEAFKPEIKSGQR